MGKYISAFVGYAVFGYFLSLLLGLPMMYLIGYIYVPIYGWNLSNLCAMEIRTGIAENSYLGECSNMAFNYHAITTALSVGISIVLFIYNRSRVQKDTSL